MHASARGGSSFALIEPLERRELLSFDPSKVGAINAGEHAWKAAQGADSYFLENHRIGYMVAALDGTLDPTSHARGGDPWSYVPGGRYQFKNGAGVPIGTLTLRNVQSTHVTVERYWAENWDEPGIRTGQKGKWNGVHTDGIYIENAKGLDPSSIFVFENVEMTEISGGQGILWEKGSARRLHFKHVYVENRHTSISGRIMLKADEQTRFDEIIFDDVTANVILMVNGGQLGNIIGTVYAHDLSPYQLESLRAELSRKGFPVDDPTRFVTGLPDDLVDARGVALARPYRGQPVPIGWTSTVEAEEYDNGQEGLAYHDTTPDDFGGSRFRTSARRNVDGVDILQTKGGHAVRMVAGEWTDYTIDVRAAGLYDVRALASSTSGGTYRVEFDGVQSTGTLAVGSGQRVYLPAGQHVMRLVAVSGTFDVDAVDFFRRDDLPDLKAPPKPSARPIGWGALDTEASGTSRVFASAVNIAWKDADGEQGYVIQRRAAGEKWQRVGAAAADVTSFADTGQWGGKGNKTGIQPGVTYEYRVVAVDAKGAQHASDPVRVRSGTPPVAAAPRQPVLRSVKARESGAVQLKWTDRSNDERGFRIERSTDPSFSTVEIVNGRSTHLSYDLPPVGAGVTDYVDRGQEDPTAYAANHVHRLRPGQTYYYRVSAYNSYGHSRPSAAVAVTTPDVDVPLAARDVTATAHESGCGAIVVTWTRAASGHAVSGYRVERRRDGGNSSWHVLGTVLGATTTFTDVALRTSNAVTHEYRVVAFNAAGDAQPSAAATMRVPRVGAVSVPPAKLRATATSPGAVRLEWEDRSGNEVGFRIERSSDGINWMLVGSVAADHTSFDDDGLMARTKYHYRVTAFNTNDTEPAAGPSAVAGVKTPGAKTPAAPNAAKKLKR
jgi:hypothetical protein